MTGLSAASKCSIQGCFRRLVTFLSLVDLGRPSAMIHRISRSICRRGSFSRMVRPEARLLQLAGSLSPSFIWFRGVRTGRTR